MTISSRPDSFELGDYLGVLRRRWLVVAVLSCVGLVLAGAYTKVAPKSYTAAVTVYVSSAISTGNAVGGRTQGSVNMDNEAQAAESDAVARLAASAMQTSLSTTALLKHITVTVPPNTTVMQINCSASTSRGAAQCANDFGAAYLRNRLATAVTAITSQITALRASQTSLTRQVAGLRAKLRGGSGSSADQTTEQLRLNAAQGELTQVETELNTDLPRLANEKQPGNDLAGYVETPASPPASPSSPRKLLLLPSGLLAGLLIGLVGAFLIDRRDLRLHTMREVERYLNLPVLLDVTTKKPDLAAALAPPRSSAGRAFTELAQDVAAALGEGSHVLLVGGTSGRPGGGIVAANLAATLARTRSEVALICADPGALTARLLGLGEGRGLAEILAGSATAGHVTRRPADLPRLRVITPGLDINGALSRLQHEESRRMMAELRGGARYVIIDSQQVGADADVFGLSEFADAAVLAVEISATSRTDAQGCLHRLDRLHVPVLGAAVLAGTGQRAGASRKAQAGRPGAAAAPAARPAPAAPAAPAPRTSSGQPRLSGRFADDRFAADRTTASDRLTDSRLGTERPAEDRLGSDPFGSYRVSDDRVTGVDADLSSLAEQAPGWDSALADRGPTETRPLPRTAIPRPDRRRASGYQNPPDQATEV